MLGCPLLRLPLLALCIAPAVAQGTAAQHPQLRAFFLPVDSESFFLQRLPPPDAASAISSAGVPGDAGSNNVAAAAAPLISRGAPPRRLALDTFFSSSSSSSDHGDQLFAGAGGGDTGRQTHPRSAPTEAVASPGTQLETYLPEGQRPPVHVGPETAELLRPGASPNSNNEEADRTGAPQRRSNKETSTAHFSGSVGWRDPEIRAAQQTTAGGTDGRALGVLPATAPSDGDPAHPAAVAVARVSRPPAAPVLRPVQRQLQARKMLQEAQKIRVLSDPPAQGEKLGGSSSTSRQADGLSAAPGSTSGTSNSGDSNPLQQVGKTRNSGGATRTSNESVDQEINSKAAVKEARTAGEYLQGAREETGVETAAAPSSILKSLLFPEEDKHDTEKAAAADGIVESPPSRMVGPQRQPVLAAGIYGASANALRALESKNIAEGREAADLISGADAAASTLSSLPAAADSSLEWLFFGGRSNSAAAGEQQAPHTETRGSLLDASTQGADTVEDTSMSEEKKAVKKVPETAQEITERANPLTNIRWFFTSSKERQPASGNPDTSSFAGRFLAQLFAQTAEKTAADSLDRAAAARQRRSWWLSGDTTDESAAEQQQHLSSSSSSAWWGNPGAAGTGDLKDVVDKAQKAYEAAGESAEGKAKTSSSPLSSLLWFLRSSREEKKEAAAKAAVKAALSWIADCRQQMQAAVKTLSPAPTPQGGSAAAAAPAAIASAAALASKHSGDASPRKEPTFFQVEELLKGLSAGQQQLSALRDAEGTSSSSSTRQQRVLEEGPPAALASWLYAGSSGDSSKSNGASQSYFPRAQHVGAPAVSLPFFSPGVWRSSAATGSGPRQQQQQLETQLAQVKPRPPALPAWLAAIFSRKAVGEGDVQAHAAAEEPQPPAAATQPGVSSWTEWILGNRQTASETQTPALIRNAATAASPGQAGKPWGEKGAALLPLAGWLPSSSTGSSQEPAVATRSLLRFFGDDMLAREEAAGGASEKASAASAAAAGGGGGLTPKVVASLQSAFLGAPQAEAAAAAKEEEAEEQPIRAPGLPRGAYWWEWQSYPEGEDRERTKAPMYMRHVHLDCDPLLPFHACVRECQKESARSLLSSSSSSKAKREEAEDSGSAADSTGLHAAEPPALDSYEYSTLRSCYLKCKQKWLDTDLPGCLTAAGVKVEGVPPAAAYRSSTTTSTTVATTASSSPAAAEAPAPSTDESPSFWSRIRGGGKQEPLPSHARASEGGSEGRSSFSIFHLRAPAAKTPPEVEQGERSLKNLFGLLQKPATVPQTAAPTLRESIAKFPQTLWSHLKSGEANAADAPSGAAGSTSSAPSHWGADSSHLAGTAEDTDGAGGSRRWWNLLFNSGSQKGDQQPQDVAPIATESRIHAVRTTGQAEAADTAGQSQLTFTHWCILLVACMCGALVSVCLVSLRRRDILTRLWSVFHSGTNAPAAASLLRWHSLYERISLKSDQCMPQFSFRSADVDTLEKSEGATQPLIRDSRPSL